MIDNETQTEITAPEGTGEGDQPEESKAVIKLRKDNERLEKQLVKKKELLAEQQAIEAREAIAGEINTGRPLKKEEETPSDYADRVMSGGLNKKDED